MDCAELRRPAAGLAMLMMSSAAWLGGVTGYWSQYYRVTYVRDQDLVNVNLIRHQQMKRRTAPGPATMSAAPWPGARSMATRSRSIRSFSASVNTIIPIVRTTILASPSISTTAATS